MIPIKVLALVAALAYGAAGFVSTPCTMLQQVNAYRRSLNVPPLILDRRLVAGAQYHTEDMFAANLMTHDSPNDVSGVCFRNRVAEYFPNWNYLAENVARNSENETEIMGVWIRSPDHDRNLRDSRARYFGSGYFNGFWTQDFGNSWDTDILFPIDCTRESGFAWPQPAIEDRDFVGTIVTPEGLCLDSVRGPAVSLSPINCVRGNLTQSWTLKKLGSGFYAQRTGSNLCIDVFNQSRNNGSVYGLWDCNPGAQNQQFIYNNRNNWIAAHSGLCAELAVAGIVHPPGTPVTQWACNTGSNQRFTPTLPVAGVTQRYGFVGTIRSALGLCLDAVLGSGRSLQANPCVAGRASQNWTLTQTGGAFMIRNTNTNNCVDLFSWNMNNNATIGVKP
ncbi:ricin B lectin domain-containing protein [Chytridium lagenaria]|nr:ricin B lectin domain-containing protein [Chytridium lagenaria]